MWVLAERREGRLGKRPARHPPPPTPGDCPGALSAQVFWICLPRLPKRETEASRAPCKAKHKGISWA